MFRLPTLRRYATFALSPGLLRDYLHPQQSEPPAPEPVENAFPKIAGAEIAAGFIGERVGGDFYDSMRVGPERILFGLMDLAGRRQDNREILTAAQQIFRDLGGELFAGSDINESNAMTELCLRLNRGLIDISHHVHSCPAFVACYHERFGTLCYTNAGHTPGLLRDRTGVSELGSTGLPLGLFSHATCEAPTVGLERGAAVLLVSCGVVECARDHDPAADEFGLERVKQLVQQAPSGSAPSLCAAILNASAQFAGESGARNDRSALVLVRTA